jgi:ribonuclease G
MVIDVNSGRYAAKKEQEQNSLRTDLEAAREICRQLRLRDVGGIIVCDFIDLDDEKNKRKVYDELRKEFRRDRAKITVLPMTEFGLVQITRQRVRQNILHSFTEQCPSCGGTGLVRTKTSVLNQLERGVRRFRAEAAGRRLILTVNPELAINLQHGFPSRLSNLRWKNGLLITLKTDQAVPVSEFRLYSPKLERDVTDQFK